MTRHPAAFLSLVTGLAMAALLSSGPVLAQQPPAQGPKQVGVMTVNQQSVAFVSTLPGRAVAQDMVDIRPRVDGLVTEILYQPGQNIEVGAPMFRIDPTTYQAAVDQANANLASSRAAVPQAQATYDRTERLQGSASTQSSLETALATLQQAQAAEKASEAALQTAEVELSWTTITSPLTGIPTVAQVSVGDLVTAGQTDALATVTQLDPIDVDMYEPSARLQRVRERIESGQIKMNETLNAQLTLENGVSYAAKGMMVAPGYTVSTSTGAIDFRFRFDNPDRRILPGMFVRGSIELGQIQAFLVPQVAATRSRDGTLSVFVARDGKAVSQVVTEEGIQDSYWIITAGLSEGDQLIVNGTTGLAAGAEITTVPVEIDENGVVRDAPAATDAATNAATEPATEAATEPATDATTTQPTQPTETTPQAADTAPKEQ